MPSLISKDEFDDILRSLNLFPEGASLKQINQSLELPLPSYTLQRRLAFLVREGKVHTKGKARALRYKLPGAPDTVVTEQPIAELQKEYPIPLSSISQKLLRKVTQPIQARTPVGYSRKFLDDYRPNTTAYLSDSVRKRLFELGRTDGEQPAGTYAREIFNRLLIDLSWNSSRLEGNTYSLLETERLLELNEISEGKDLAEAQMILNHKAAIEFIVDAAQEIDINRQTVLNVHALLANNLLADPNAYGNIRSKMIAIGKSVYHPLIVPTIINECFDQILDTARAIHDPFEQAFFLMVHLPYLQPFEDVNKRVSRLVANIPLIRDNLSPLSFMDVPQNTYVNGLLAVYELNSIDLLRDVFMWAYERSSALYSATVQTLGEPDPFRLRYRNIICETIANIVQKSIDKKGAIKIIKLKANQFVSPEDKLRFIEVVEIELRGLHEGNIARYRLRPLEYEAWKKVWH